MTFGDIYQYTYGHGMTVVYLCKQRNGIHVLGAENGGRITLTEAELDEYVSTNKLVKKD